MARHTPLESILPQLSCDDDVYSFWAKILKESCYEEYTLALGELASTPCPIACPPPSLPGHCVSTADDGHTYTDGSMIHSHEFSEFVTALRILVASISQGASTIRDHFLTCWQRFLPQEIVTIVDELRYDGSEDDVPAGNELLRSVCLHPASYTYDPRLITWTAEVVATMLMDAKLSAITETVRYQLTTLVTGLAFKRYAVTVGSERDVRTTYGSRYHFAFRICMAFSYKIVKEELNNRLLSGIWGWMRQSCLAIHGERITKLITKIQEDRFAPLSHFRVLVDYVVCTPPPQIKFDDDKEVYFGLDGRIASVLTVTNL